MSDVTTVGDKVKLKKDNMVGTIKFIGEIKDKKGTFYGVELDSKYKTRGKNDGSVGKICYFKGRGKNGLFVKKTAIIKTISKNNKHVPRVTVGDTIQCIKAKCKGIIKFIGIPYSLKKAGVYYGIQLEKPKGTNNGTVKDRYYFKCKKKYGIFLKEEDFITHEQKLIKTTGKSGPKNSKKSNSKKNSKKKYSKNESDISDEKNEMDNHESANINTNNIQIREMKENEKSVMNLMENGLRRLQEILIAKDAQIARLSRQTNDTMDTMTNKSDIMIKQSHTNITNQSIEIISNNPIQMEIKQLKDALETKENEIINQKKMYQELERKSAEEMDHMKVLLEEQKRMNDELKQEMLQQATEIINEITMDTSSEESIIDIPEKKEKIILDRHIDSLVSGYIRELINITNEDEVFPDNIIDVCVMFCFMGQIFTNQHSKYVHIIEKGTRIKSLGIDDVDVCFPSDVGYKSGVHMWRLQCIDSAQTQREIDTDYVGHAIGISTDFLKCCDCQINKLKNSVYYDGHEGIIWSCIDEKRPDKKTEWGKGDIMVVVLDCDQGNVSFYKNEENIGTYDVVENKTYYLIIQLNSTQGYDYKVTQYV